VHAVDPVFHSWIVWTTWVVPLLPPKPTCRIPGLHVPALVPAALVPAAAEAVGDGAAGLVVAALAAAPPARVVVGLAPAPAPVSVGLAPAGALAAPGLAAGGALADVLEPSAEQPAIVNPAAATPIATAMDLPDPIEVPPCVITPGSHHAGWLTRITGSFGICVVEWGRD
jgi:hypothetical protein